MNRALVGVVLVVLGLATEVYIEVADLFTGDPTNPTNTTDMTVDDSQTSEDGTSTGSTDGPPMGSAAFVEENTTTDNATVQLSYPPVNGWDSASAWTPVPAPAVEAGE